MMRFVPLLLILLISCSPLKKYPLKSDRWENDIKFLESKDREEACVEDCILFVGSSSIRLWKEIESDMSPYKVVKRGYGGAHFYDLIHYTKRLVKNHKPRAIAVFVANDITGKNNNSWYGDLKPKEVLQLFKFFTKEDHTCLSIYPEKARRPGPSHLSSARSQSRAALHPRRRKPTRENHLLPGAHCDRIVTPAI